MPEEAATCLKPDTCEPKLCACVANGGNAYECAHEMHAVCQGVTNTARNIDGMAETWTIDDCVDERRVEYYTNVYCPFTGCIANGGTYNQCSCDHFYKPYCELYGTTFSESEIVQLYCEKAKCCAAAKDDAERGICLFDATLIFEDSLDPSLLVASPGLPNSADPSVTNRAVPHQAATNQVLPTQAMLSQDLENGGGAPIRCFGLSLVSTLAIFSAFLFNG